MRRIFYSVVLLALLLVLLAQSAPTGGPTTTHEVVGAGAGAARQMSEQHVNFFSDLKTKQGLGPTTKMMLYAEWNDPSAGSKPHCQSWCGQKIVARVGAIRYHDWKEKCEWGTCSACSPCAELAEGKTVEEVEEVWTASRATHRTQSGWEPRNLVGGSELFGKFPLPSRVDHDACSEHCAQDELCTSVTWNCDARCYMRTGPVSYGSTESCTYSWLKPLGDRAPILGSAQSLSRTAHGGAQCSGVYVPLHVPGIVTTAKALSLPPTVCCNWTGLITESSSSSSSSSPSVSSVSSVASVSSVSSVSSVASGLEHVLGFSASAMDPMPKAAPFFHVLIFMVVGQKQVCDDH